MIRLLRNLALAAVAAVALVAAPPAADAGVEPGTKPPAWAVKDAVNIPVTSVDVQTLQGRVVLLEIFRTW